MTANDRIDALEKQVTEQRDQIKALAQMLINTTAAGSAYQAATLALLATTPLDGRLDGELTRRLFSIEATTVCSAENQDELDGFEEAREVIEEARAQAQS